MRLTEGECGVLIVNWAKRTIDWHGLYGFEPVMSPDEAMAIAAASAGPQVEVQLLTAFDVDGVTQICVDTPEDFPKLRCDEDE